MYKNGERLANLKCLRRCLPTNHCGLLQNKLYSVCLAIQLLYNRHRRSRSFVIPRVHTTADVVYTSRSRIFFYFEVGRDHRCRGAGPATGYRITRIELLKNLLFGSFGSLRGNVFSACACSKRSGRSANPRPIVLYYFSFLVS